MRLFIAADFEELSGYFRQLQRQIPEAKATFTKQFHLTLKFLGEVDDSSLGEIQARLRKVKFKPFAAHTSGIGVFPNERMIRVVWAGLKEEKEFAELQKKIDESLEGLFRKEKDFAPHITLARVKFIESSRKEEFAEAVKKIKAEEKELNVICFKLIKSTLAHGGPVYEEIAAFSGS